MDEISRYAGGGSVGKRMGSCIYILQGSIFVEDYPDKIATFGGRVVVSYIIIIILDAIFFLPPRQDLKFSLARLNEI